MAKIGLVLQGGGAFGAYQVGVVQRLLEQRLEPHIVSGVSIGAANAAVLCAPRSRDPVASLKALWEDLTVLQLPIPLPFVNESAALMGNPGMYQPRMDYYNLWQWRSFYDNTPFIKTLEKHIDFDQLRPGAQAPRLILTATNIRSGNLDVFDSRIMRIRPAHIVASGSLPPGFPATSAPDAEGEEQNYWDGGLFDNTPLSHVISRLETGSERVEVMVVVNLIPKRGAMPTDILQVFDRMFEIIFASKLFRDTQLAQKINTLADFRQRVAKALPLIEASLPESASDARQALKELTQHDGFQVLARWLSVFDRIVEIENTEHEPVNALSDFSATAIQRRQEAGYRDTCAQLP
jgi:predicted acylesterase/phospholipase RssA